MASVIDRLRGRGQTDEPTIGDGDSEATADFSVSETSTSPENESPEANRTRRRPWLGAFQILLVVAFVGVIFMFSRESADPATAPGAAAGPPASAGGPAVGGARPVPVLPTRVSTS